MYCDGSEALGRYPCENYMKRKKINCKFYNVQER